MTHRTDRNIEQDVVQVTAQNIVKDFEEATGRPARAADVRKVGDTLCVMVVISDIFEGYSSVHAIELLRQILEKASTKFHFMAAGYTQKAYDEINNVIL